MFMPPLQIIVQMGGKILHFVQNDIPYIGYDIYDVPPYLIRGNATPKLSTFNSCKVHEILRVAPSKWQ